MRYMKSGQPIYNFSAGPAMLPAEVLRQAQAELLDWQGSGVSVMEMSHRSETFLSIAAQVEADLRELLQIPVNYKVLFLHGGASAQFAMVPLNLLTGKQGADYFHTGFWSGKAMKEASRFCRVRTVATGNDRCLAIPEPETWNIDPEAAYVYYTDNETINGVEFPRIPEIGERPLVSDMTSSLLSKPLDITRLGIIFAGVQKNMGPAALAVVIVREDLLGRATIPIPSMYDYAVQAESNSMYNTPPVYSWYMTGLVLQWIKRQGGVKVMDEMRRQRSEKLYAAIDDSNFYHNAVVPKYRSCMNIPFNLMNDALNEKFLCEAEVNGLLALRGHRLVGGMRASMYNAMPVAGVDALVDFMQDFARNNL